jgi:hypothetical protein
MRGIIEIVEEFIEALFAGDVITGVHDTEYIVSMRSEHADFVGDQMELMEKLTGTEIPLFMTSQGEQKVQRALKIFNAVLSLRNKGFLMNNPNSAKEIAFLRAKAIYFADRNKELLHQTMDLKAGSSGIR